MSAFPITEAQIVSLFMESVGFGLHIATFIVCLRTLLGNSRGVRKPINWPLLCIAISLFIVGAYDVALSLYHIIVAFVLYQGPGGAAASLDHISNWVNVFKSSNNFAQTLIADAALIYRCWVIYGHRWAIIILPSIVWVADTIVSAVEVYYTATLRADSTLPEAQRANAFAQAYISLTFVQNVMTTGLIIYRIWTVHKQSSRYFSQSYSTNGAGMGLSRINRILIESAMLYTIVVFITLVVDFDNNNSVYGVSSFLVEIAGVQFDLIIIRVGQGIATEHMQTAVESQQLELRIRRDTTVERSGGSKTVMQSHPSHTHFDVEDSSLHQKSPGLVEDAHDV
ncbi:hypothetical protein POSPLADRAFT_1039690 [Postia placenta MAD-698-R-SB12]|uniref:Uncharacterized protein n=1 Tax=Postia placenta MAD-698-R-SB12 TaxID=670580 RepID=A0A1X6N205_9APHY|nr:hypothetical protein POSPLADRAFT_1039690 [Postia placenta MAD-698-R-SB12]OSX62655.1 hypothetical protein POSPLADRAFT_1039690 [Postia placenta MAD-698-R-SB12]